MDTKVLTPRVTGLGKRERRSGDKTNICAHVENKFKNFKYFRLKALQNAKEENLKKNPHLDILQ